MENYGDVCYETVETCINYLWPTMQWLSGAPRHVSTHEKPRHISVNSNLRCETTFPEASRMLCILIYGSKN